MSKATVILIVDDETNIRRILQATFEKIGYKVHVAENGKQALQVLERNAVDVVLSDVVMPDMNGVELLKAINENKPDLAVVLMTAFGTIPQAVDTIRHGAFDYLAKPFELDMVKKLVARAVEHSQDDNGFGYGKKKSSKLNKQTVLIGSSPKMQEITQMIERVASARATVLITGESGTGKEVIAKTLHEKSDRASKPFIAVSCAALPETLLESELFGYEKGAFTGADTQKQGRFELAHEGTLFLDEIGEIPLTIQVKLLRVLQEREFERLGGAKPVRVDVRLITATNRDLNDAVKAGVFRQDLYYRLQVVQLSLPPLRERTDDIPPLCQHFITKYNAENKRNLTGVASDVMDALIAYEWQGNIRELENTIERAVVLAGDDDSEITLDLLPPHIAKL